MVDRTKDEITERVTQLFENTMKFLTSECERDDYAAAELYIAVAMIKQSLANGIGSAGVKIIEKAFTLVSPTDWKKA